MRFSRAELAAFRGGTLPDLVEPGVRLLFVGVNPGLRTVAVQAHFGRRGNRFYPALFRAGIVDRLIDASAGFLPDDRAHLSARGIGITSLVAAATARADELSVRELTSGARALAERVARIGPRVVAVLGITAYRIAFERPKALVGRQPYEIGGAQLWVVPNPSGLNAHATLAGLADAYREVALAAGIGLFDNSP
ncbi:mismatch-specific DNA-glycosylase [Micromonospora sp. NBC_01796]|uniref:mismatch-specific DNA-glycosylase n=1 Tax=Micromonospora sp. NBC_01796 TaxID=2975987 RepID=UPI002DDA063A|nr:mismatch-specific DNA-glycosylase [Micromonospora sp. NBC_01796]WSA83715.1 mismatch-specific DNA-glycosylase [Micromonospora sp. NBC_01796]